MYCRLPNNYHSKMKAFPAGTPPKFEQQVITYTLLRPALTIFPRDKGYLEFRYLEDEKNTPLFKT